MIYPIFLLYQPFKQAQNKHLNQKNTTFNIHNLHNLNTFNNSSNNKIFMNRLNNWPIKPKLICIKTSNTLSLKSVNLKI